MSLLIKQPLNLGAQTFRINRAEPVKTIDGGWTWGKREGWWKIVTCQRSGDPCFDRGFAVKLELAPSLPRDLLAINQKRYKVIKEESGRAFTERWEGALCIFEFPAGQKCFGHSVPVDRDPVFANLSPKTGAKVMNHDEFFSTWNETVTQQRQRRREF